MKNYIILTLLIPPSFLQGSLFTVKQNPAYFLQGSLFTVNQNPAYFLQGSLFTVKQNPASFLQGSLFTVNQHPASFLKSSYSDSEKNLFDKALTHLQKDQTEEAQKLFSQFLKQNPNSIAGRFNLALTFFREGQAKDPARAHLRQILFKNPYHMETRTFLKHLEDKIIFWLWMPKDLVLSLLALSWLILIIALFKKSFLAFRLFMPLFGGILGLSTYYFYLRQLPYSSLMQNSLALSAPDSEAPALFEAKAGAIVKKLSTEDDWVHIQSSKKRGWVKSSLLLPLNTHSK